MISRYTFLCSQLCQVSTVRSLTSTNWPVSTDCVKRRTPHKRGKHLEFWLSPSLLTNAFLSKMEHTSTKDPLVLKSLKRKHSTDDVTDSAKELKPDEMLEGMAAAKLQDRVESDDRTAAVAARPRGSMQNCDIDRRGNMLLMLQYLQNRNLFYDFICI